MACSGWPEQYAKHFTRAVTLEGAGRCPDANAQSLDLFCEEFSDGVISLAGYAPKSVEMRISIGGNQGGVVMRRTNAIANLRQQIHYDLRRQHPEWVLPNGESPMCDAYEARLMDELSELGVQLTDDARPNGSRSEITSTPR